MFLALALLLPALQAPAPSELRVQDLQAHIGFLASDELEGRESGSKSEQLAVRYIAEQYQRLGLQPVGADGSYLLPFTLPRYPGKTFVNTAALLPGTDPSRADQIIVLGAHHDHAGTGGADVGAMGFPGEIHNGADDNASGTAGVLELAEWFAAHPQPRPLLFLTFSAEERGLLGSAWFVENGPIPRSRMRAMINLDMIGRSRDRYLFLGGLGTADRFHEILDPLIEQSGLAVETHDGGEAPSDNSSFHRAGIPALFFFTNIHEDYHLPGDDADKILYEGEVAVLELARAVAVALCRDEGTLTFQERAEFALPADFMARMSEHSRMIQQRNARRGKAGLTFERESPAGELVVASLRPESAAARAGVEKGDLLIRIAGSDVATRLDVARAMAGREKGEEIEVVVRRAGVERAFRLTLE